MKLEIPKVIQEIGFAPSYHPKISLTGANNLSYENLIIEADSAVGIDLDNCTNITFRNIILYGYNDSFRGIRINNSSNIKLLNFIGIEQGGRIQIQGTCNDVLVGAGRQINCCTKLKSSSGRNAIQLLNGQGNNIRIIGNRFLLDLALAKEVATSVDTNSIYNFQTEGSYIIGNYYKGSTKITDDEIAGGGVMKENLKRKPAHWHVWNNRFHSTGRYGIRHASGIGGSVLNNLVWMPKVVSPNADTNKYAIGMFMDKALDIGDEDDYGSSVYLDGNRVYFQLDTNTSGNLDDGYENGFGSNFPEFLNLRFGTNNFMDTTLRENDVVPSDFMERFWLYTDPLPPF